MFAKTREVSVERRRIEGNKNKYNIVVDSKKANYNKDGEGNLLPEERGASVPPSAADNVSNSLQDLRYTFM